jgi:acyl-CoA synthetase (AMP-forming)/AMP-acid ligase II
VPDDFVSSFAAMAADAPQAVAIATDGRSLSWQAFAERSRRLAWYFATEARLERGDRVAISLGSDAEALEALYATLMLGGAPVVLSDDLDVDTTHAVVDRSDAKVVVHGPGRTKQIRTAVRRIGKRWRPLLLEIGDHYERVIHGAPPAGEWRPQHAATEGVLLLAAGPAAPGAMLVWDEAELVDALRASLDASPRGARVLSLVPVTQTAGCFTALRTLLAGGTVVLEHLEPFEASAVWDAVDRDDVEVVSGVGRAAMRSLIEALSESTGRWQLAQLRLLVSSVVMDAVTRNALAQALPSVELREPSDEPRRVGDRLRVIELATGRDVTPGSGEVGTVVTGGAVPLGYHGDPVRTASSFCSIDGVRYAITGERATVDAAGIVHRADDRATTESGSEQLPLTDVEGKLRKHSSVAECVVVAVADAARGDEKIVALVQVEPGHYLDEAELVAWCRSRLGKYPPPERFLFVERLTADDCDPSNRDHVRRWAAELLGS